MIERRSMERNLTSRPTLVTIMAGVLIAALSVIPAWLTHDRALTGEGHRSVLLDLSAWRLVAVPVLPAGVLAALLAVLLTVARARGRAVPRWSAVAASVVALACFVASAWPLREAVSNSVVRVSPGWALVMGIGLAVVLVVASARFMAPTRTELLAVALVGVVTLGIAGSARVVGFALRVGSWASPDATYTRLASDGTVETFTMADGAYVLGDAWSGTFRRSGIRITLHDDPACPDLWGTYLTVPADDGTVRFDMIVDLCAGGERARHLGAGAWKKSE